jgi:predicted dehydrogenase
VGESEVTRDGLTGVVIGAGDRGFGAYTPYLLRHPEQGRIVAVAEPDAKRRSRFAHAYTLADEALHQDGFAFLRRPREADFVLISTGDLLHVELALSALAAGYHVLLEKPMALCEEDCRAITDAAERSDRVLQVCHVLRYAPLFSKLKTIAASGELGRIVTIQHSENVSHWHYAHSYCRGHFRRSSEAPMILAKSCHDLDILYWLADADPISISSSVRPTELCPGNAPEGAPAYCIEGCRYSETCPYDAVAMYLDLAPLLKDLALTRHPRWIGVMARLLPRLLRMLRRIPSQRLRGALGWDRWPVAVITDDPTPEGIACALRTTRWGKCVYKVGDNDQPSSQTVGVRFQNGVNASFTMHSTSYREGREIRVDGTRGSAVGCFYTAEQRLEVIDHKTGRRRSENLPHAMTAHGGGDQRLFAGFLAAIRGETEPLTTAHQSLQSHLMAFAATKSAREGVVVAMNPR